MKKKLTFFYLPAILSLFNNFNKSMILRRLLKKIQIFTITNMVWQRYGMASAITRHSPVGNVRQPLRHFQPKDKCPIRRTTRQYCYICDKEIKQKQKAISTKPLKCNKFHSSGMYSYIYFNNEGEFVLASLNKYAWL